MIAPLFWWWPHRRATSPGTSWCAPLPAEDSGGINMVVGHFSHIYLSPTFAEKLACSPYLLHVLIKEVEDVPLLFLCPIPFHMVIPGAPWHWNQTYCHSLVEVNINHWTLMINQVCSGCSSGCREINAHRLKRFGWGWSEVTHLRSARMNLWM